MTMLRERTEDIDETERVVIAESARPGEPHVNVAREVRALGNGRVEVSGRFARDVYEGARRRARIAVIVWSGRTQEGYQVLGNVERADGPRTGDAWGRLVVSVGKIAEFKQGGQARAL